MQIDDDPDGVIPHRRRQIGEQINERLQYGGEPMEFEDEEGNLGGEEARDQFIEGSFRQNVLA